MLFHGVLKYPHFSKISMDDYGLPGTYMQLNVLILIGILNFIGLF
jgi:hypothetical protein